jgi:uncharacterized protein YdcH (DUF465 family)
MTDRTTLVQRLRNTTFLQVSHPHFAPIAEASHEAADEIERLQDQNSLLLVTNYDLRKERDRMTDELAEAREWIEETGHRISCPWRHTKLTSTDLWPACDCGFIALLAAKEGER